MLKLISVKINSVYPSNCIFFINANLQDSFFDLITIGNYAI